MAWTGIVFPVVMIVGLSAVFLGGCSGTEMASSSPVVQEDPADDAGNPFGDGPGTGGAGIPIEDDEAAPEPKGPALPEAKAAIIKPVEISRRSGSLGTCVIGEPCEKKVTAKGGSGEYAWTITEGRLPNGLELADIDMKKARIQKRDGEEIDEVGEFTFKLKVEDAADPARSAERKLSLTVKENIAMVLYTMAKDGAGNDVWAQVEEDPVVVPPNGILLVEAIGHAESYAWSINGQQVVCNDTGCEGINDGLRLFKDTSFTPPNPPEHYEYMILKAEENFIGQEHRDIIIAVEDAVGDEASKTISSITFQQEPCKIPLAVTGGEVTAKPGESYTTSFSMTGGLAPYSWREGNGGWQPVTENSFDVSGTAAGSTALTLKQLKEGFQVERQFEVKDSCPMPQTEAVPLAVSVPLDDGLIDDVSDIRVQTRFDEINDTSGDGSTWLEIRFNSKGTQLGMVHYNLDPCGDNGDESVCEGVRSIQDARQGVKITEIDEIAIHFYDEDCFLCGYLDCDITTVTISTDHWKASYDDGNTYEGDVCGGGEHCGGSITKEMDGYKDATNDIWNIWQYTGS